MPDISIPLNIPDVEIVSTDFTHDRYIITVKSTVQGTKCHRCGKWITKLHGYAPELTLQHLPILDQAVYIRIRPVRYQCENCDDCPTTTQQLDWYDRKSSCTKAYEDYILRCLINSTIQDVSRKEKVAYKMIVGIVERKVKATIDWELYQQLGIIGVDEIALKKGHSDYVVIVSAKTAGKLSILAVLKDRKRETLEVFFNSIPAPLRKTIHSLCCDMYENFIMAAQNSFGDQVNIVVDRFHVAQLYRRALDKLRSKELKRLKATLSEKDYSTLKGAMWILRKKKEYLSKEDKQVLAQLFSYSPDLKLAYQLSLELTHIFNSHLSKRSALRKINRWIKRVQNSPLTCFDKFIGTLNKYKEPIINYFVNRYSSGFVEGLNNKLKVIKRRCYGILKPSTLFQRLFIDIEWGVRCYA